MPAREIAEIAVSAYLLGHSFVIERRAPRVDFDRHVSFIRGRKHEG